MSASSRADSRAAIVIIGGGIQGLALAYNLATLGQRSVSVVDAGYFQGGASGRNGTMIRGGFVSPEWTALFALANRRWIELSRSLGHNVMFSRRGYLLIAETERSGAIFDRALAVHRDHGVVSRRVTRAEVARLAPLLNVSRIRDAVYLPEGGVAPHHAAMAGYLDACRKMGVSVRYGERVTRIEATAGRASHVLTQAGRIATDLVVIAAGAQGNEVARLAGLALPGFPMRIECMALEPTRPLLHPGLALIDRLCYLSQTARGEIVGGAEVPECPQVSLNADLPAMAATARVYLEMLPALARLRILRHWAGMIHATPDFGPLIGPHPVMPNVWVTGGWAYGFASAPAVGELIARAILEGTIDRRILPFGLDRFERGAPVLEGGIVLAPPVSDARPLVATAI